MAKNKLGIPYMTHVLDDFLIIASSHYETGRQLHWFLSFCSECGIPMAPEKTEGPSRELPFLGITLNVPHFVAQLPSDKLENCRVLITQATQSKESPVNTWAPQLCMSNSCPGKSFPAQGLCADTQGGQALPPYQNDKRGQGRFPLMA